MAPQMASEVDYRAVFRAAPECYVVVDRNLAVVDASEAYLRVVARSREELLGRSLLEAFPAPAGDGPGELEASLKRVLATRRPDTIALVDHAIARSGAPGTLEPRYWSATHLPLLDARGEVHLILQHTQDVTALVSEGADAPDRTASLKHAVAQRARRVQAVNRMLKAEHLDLQRLFKQAPGFMCVLRGPRHVVQIANNTFRQIIGKNRVRGLPIRELLPELDEQYHQLLDEAFRTGRAFRGAGMQVELRRGPAAAPETLYVDLVLQPIVDPDGTVSGIFVQGNDVTAGILAQQALARHQERLEELVRERTEELARSQAELHQARQLEAVGQLTGGVAHDFNNALQVIGGNLHMLRDAVAGDPVNEQRLRLALDSVERGARLASQLLAFARRQPLAPRPVDLRQLLARMDELLRRAVGEAIAIELRAPDDAWTASVDPTQLENVILNLVINARDAMEGRGRLMLEIENFVAPRPAPELPDALSAGEYVALRVTDTGCGMSAQVRERAFQPFFTTKPAGQGTGLGLSQAYGFIRQSGGRIEIESAAGQGTSVTLYLPRTRQPPIALESAEPGPIEGGHETVLVVDDDPAVRATVVQMLSELGYRMLEAEDAERALAIVEAGTHVDVLFTDVVMPGPVRSEELARRARAKLPGLVVLFTSGYTEHSIVHDGRLDPGVTLLPKPYQREELARKLRELLAPEPERPVREAAAARALPAPAAADAAAGPKPGPGLRVLLVEDNEFLRSTSAEYIREMGHEVRACANAFDAARLLDGDPCDVLITDVNLPGKSGLEFAQEIASRHPGTAIVIATGYSDLGADAPLPGAALLPKPYDVPQLEALLRKLASPAAD